MKLTNRIAEQLRRPQGSWGVMTGIFMSLANRKVNEWTISLLDIQPTDHVLEVGFGPGLAIHKVATLTPHLARR
jgi:ubiquinone/menaquinone biosynthesis C-methylase UbiE